jgi:small subunit ribosomal protein S16
MLKIRLRAVGLKHQPSFRLIVADSEAPRDGRLVESLGFYNPRTDPATVSFNESRIYHWLSVGAQPTESVSALFKSVGLTDRYERLRKGEPQEGLLAEASKAYAQPAARSETQ